MCGDPEFLAAWADTRFGSAIRHPVLLAALRGHFRRFSYAVKTNVRGMVVVKVILTDGQTRSLTRSDMAFLCERRRRLRGEPRQKLITDFIVGKTSLQSKSISV